MQRRPRLMIAIVLAGCGSEGAKFDPPPPQAVASCELVEKAQGSVLHNALWFDSAGQLIQTDGYGGSTTYEYDAQGQLVQAKTPHETITWTYEPARITEKYPRYTEVFELGGDGRVMHYEGPEEFAASARDTEDFQYDTAGHITSLSGISHYSDSENGPVMTSSFLEQFTYDAQGRLTSASHSPNDLMPPTSYSYTETPGHLTIALGGDFQGYSYAYDFDAADRIVHAAVNDDNQATTYGVTYSYVDDRITATTDSGDLEVDSTGMCPGLTTMFGPYDPLPMRPNGAVLALPNPPVDEFNEDLY